MRRALMAVLVASTLAASAMGITLTPIAPNGADTTSEGRAITSDGRYVAGLSGTGTGVLWDATNGTRPVSGSAAATVATGVAYRTVGGNQQIVVNGTSTYSSAQVNTIWVSGDAGATWGTTIRNVNINSTVLVANNSLASNGLDDTFYGTYTSNNTGRVYTQRGSGDPAGVAIASLTGLSPAAQLRGISGTGLAAGWRRASTSDTTRCNWKAQDPVTLVSAGYFKGLKAGSNYGEAFAVSADGTKIAGYSPVDGGRIGSWPYIYDVATDAISELPTLADVGGFATNGVVYGLSSDGSYAVGHNFRVVAGVGHESAVYWDIQANTVRDLTDLAAAAGVLGNFTQLSRAYSVGVNAAGNPVITGTGAYNDNGTTVTRGFVIEIPEPSSVLLLVLGGAALLARRR